MLLKQKKLNTPNNNINNCSHEKFQLFIPVHVTYLHY